jgi:hypothetical protein
MNTDAMTREIATSQVVVTDPNTNGGRGYVNADGSPRPFPLWYCLKLVGIYSVFFPLLMGETADSIFFRRAYLQRKTVMFSVALLQIMRALLAWVVWNYAWTWIAWVIVPILVWRIWKTSNLWWSLLENPAVEKLTER